MKKEDHFDILNCGVCGSSHTNSKVYLKDDIYTINECSNCSTFWVTPRLKPDKLNEIYQTIYWNSESPKDLGYADYLNQEKLYKKTFNRRLKSIEPFLKENHNLLMDIGCSNGVFLNLMGDKGWSGLGIDISNFIIEEAKKNNKNPKLNFRAGYLENTLNDNETFDLITMWDVIEHVEKPLEILTKINNHLNDDGLLVLETQNIKSVFARVLKKKWHHFKHYEHIYHFNKKSLHFILEKSGFEISNISSKNAGKYIEIDFLIERSERVLPKQISALFSYFLYRIRKMALYANMHDEYIVIAKKKRN